MLLSFFQNELISCGSTPCPFKRLPRRQRQTAIKLPITPLGWNGSSARKDRRQYLSYFSEIALELLRHLLQFVLISCSCAVAISSKRSAVAHTGSEGHWHACITPHLHWEKPYNLQTCTALLRFMKQRHDSTLTQLGLGAKHLSAVLAGSEGWLSTVLLF